MLIWLYRSLKIHRQDGPAIEYTDGIKEWYINGERLTEQEFNSRKTPCDGKIIEVDGTIYH